MRLLQFCAVTLAGIAFGQDGSYTFESANIHDTARLVEPAMFAPDPLLSELRAFAVRECNQRIIARLIVAATPRDLAAAVNAQFMEMSSTGVANASLSSPGVLGQNVVTLRVAQVLCVGGDATAIIRQGKDVTQYQLAGSHDSRKWNVRGLNFTLVGFHLHGDDADIWMQAFVRTEVLPNIETAAAIRDEIERRTGIQTLLAVRTDPFFWDMGGPKFDVFEVPVPRISGQEFLTRPYISCPPAREHQPCRIRTSH
jgi:hypothetical protein